LYTDIQLSLKNNVNNLVVLVNGIEDVKRLMNQSDANVSIST